MAEKAQPDLDLLNALAEHMQENPDDAFIFALFNRATILLESHDIPRTAIALEMLQSAFSAFEGGLTHQDLSAGYPLKAWREDTVEIPRAWLRVLVEGWASYKRAPSGTTFGEALELEGGGQGKKKSRQKLSQLNAQIHISNKVLEEYLFARASGQSGSWARACQNVAEAEGVSIDTVKRASKNRKVTSLKSFKELKLLK